MIDNNYLRPLKGLEELSNLVSFLARRNGLRQTFDFSRLTKLQVLQLEGHPLGGIAGLEQLKNLTYLNLDYSNMSQIGDLSALSELAALRLVSNRSHPGLKHIGDLSRLNKLISLDLSGNHLTAVGDLSRLNEMEYLNLEGNQLPAVGDLSGLVRLRYLNLSGNKLADIGDLSRLKSLAHLDLSDNQLSEIGDVSTHKELEALKISGNRFTELSDLSHLEKLTDLWLGGNPFRSMGFIKNIKQETSRAFGFSGDQLPAFNLGEGWHNLRDLTVGAAPGLSLDLARRPLEKLTISGFLTAEQIKNPGIIKYLWVEGDGYYLAEITSLLKKMRKTEHYFFPDDFLSLGDAATELKLGRAYSLKELSPRLAEEYKTAGFGAEVSVLSVYDSSAPGPFSILKGHTEKPDAFTFKDGKITFVESGDYRPVIAARGGRYNVGAIVSHLEIFSVH